MCNGLDVGDIDTSGQIEISELRSQPVKPWQARATFQVQYRCLACGALTEKRSHCDGVGVEPARGLAMLDNDMVNVVSAVTGAITAVIVASIF